MQVRICDVYLRVFVTQASRLLRKGAAALGASKREAATPEMIREHTRWPELTRDSPRLGTRCGAAPLSACPAGSATRAAQSGRSRTAPAWEVATLTAASSRRRRSARLPEARGLEISREDSISAEIARDRFVTQSEATLTAHWLPANLAPALSSRVLFAAGNLGASRVNSGHSSRVISGHLRPSRVISGHFPQAGSARRASCSTAARASPAATTTTT